MRVTLNEATIAVVIPAYNEAATIRDVASRCLAKARSVFVIDDGSTDGTSDALADLPITLIRNEVNRGKAASLWIGASAALERGAVAVVTIDGDGQHHPEDISSLLRVASTRPSAIVIGSRLHAKAEIPPSRYRANRFANFWISWAAGRAIDDTQSGFRLYPAAIFRELVVRHDRAHSFVFESEVLIVASEAGFDVVTVPVAVSYAVAHRASHFRPVADIARIAAMLTRRLIGRRMNLRGLTRSLQRDELRGIPSPIRLPRKR
ncbi:MAG TPA: glycosyltransferase family 2 protein [Casimicrobiaceae bacterium]|nr:glycosyltransferase family 2 protein [Casimicrobiaceae bacterium]